MPPPEKNPSPPKSYLFLLKPVSLTKILSSVHRISVWSEKHPHSPADDSDNEEAAAAHLPRTSDSHATEVSFNANIWEQTALMLAANKVQRGMKSTNTHANAAHVNHEGL